MLGQAKLKGDFDMAKEAVKTVKEPSNLPSYTTVDNIIDLIDAYRKRNGNENEAKTLFGKAKSVYTNTRTALRVFGLLKEDSCDFTPDGRAIAYSSEPEKKVLLSKILMKYFPYESLVCNIFQRGFVAETTIEDITNFWGRFSYGSTERNMEDAAKLFMSIMEYLGHGKFTVGRAGKPTRIVWVEGVDIELTKEIADTTSAEPVLVVSTVPTVPTVTNEEKSKTNDEVAEVLEVQPQSPEMDVEHFEPIQVHTNPRVSVNPVPVPNITINVDMTTWSEEKIESFFRNAYGLFKEEK